MVAYSFKKQFAEPILAGTKGGTIRSDRKRHARPGEELQLYTGMRTKQCRLITRKPCLAASPITLSFATGPRAGDRPSVLILDPATDRPDKIFTGHAERDRFAQFDGFADWDDLEQFWRQEHETIRGFRGVHIRWLDWPEGLRL